MKAESLFYFRERWVADKPFTPSRGLMFGDGVFETLRTYAGVPFQWAEHYKRLTDSARAALIPCPTEAKLLGLVQEAMRRLGSKECRMRITLFRKLEPQRRGKETDVALTAIPFRGLSIHFYRKGVKLSFSSSPRYSVDVLNPRIKTTSLQAFVLAGIARRGGFDVVYRNRKGFITETTTANLFRISHGKLCTPDLACGVLSGVTRSLLLTLSPSVGLEPCECWMTAADLYVADEVLISNSVFELLPVVEIEGRKIGEGVPGSGFASLFQQLQNAKQKEVIQWNSRKN